MSDNKEEEDANELKSISDEYMRRIREADKNTKQSNNPRFGETVVITIPRLGDLMERMERLRIILPCPVLKK